MKKCPYCAEEVQDEAIKCKHCGSNLLQPAKICPKCRRIYSLSTTQCHNHFLSVTLETKNLDPKKVPEDLRELPEDTVSYLKKEKAKQRSNKQGGGCLMIIIGLFLCVLSPVLGGIVAVIGIVLLLIGLTG